jgi:tRNA-splicing ligase RtcB
MERWFINLPDKDLAYIPQGSDLFEDYFEAIDWAQGFARLNRDLMMEAALSALSKSVPKPFTCDQKAVNCHHNYVSWERHFGENVMVTRKGAVDAHEGVLGIIPGSMGAKSFIVRGKGNREAFMSCSHGAGRAMSRGEARKRFTLEDHAKATEGVECRKDADVIDETPSAYKSIDAVMAAQDDLVEVVHTLKQVVCVKG